MQPRPRMSNWLDPFHLIGVGVRAGLSALFGEFADRRDAQAAVRPLDPDEATRVFAYGPNMSSHHGEQQLLDEWDPHPQADCEPDGSFWFDYMADTGDGWNQTYSMARLLARPSGLKVTPLGKPSEETRLPRGRVLVLGGDQVYPMASPEDYETRLISPFDEAAKKEAGPAAHHRKFADIFAIPGNHDWYDGLRSFLGIFCRFSLTLRNGRLIGGRRAPQTRSYFALELPHNWWVWGVDSQLKGYVDQPQIDYFANVAKNKMDAKSNLIICTGYPSWTRVDPVDPGERFSSYAYVERLIDNYGGASGSGQVRLALSGDLHHYARHSETVYRTDQEVSDGTTFEPRSYITCGGGGAYAHPTTDVRTEKFVWKWPAPRMSNDAQDVERKFDLSTRNGGTGSNDTAAYPDARTSRLLAFWAFALPVLNPGFTAFMGLIAGILYFAIGYHLGPAPDFYATIQRLGWRAVCDDSVLGAIATVPWLYFHLGISLFAYFKLADFDKDTRLFDYAILNSVTKLFVGAVHAVAMTGALIAVGFAWMSWFAPSGVGQSVVNWVLMSIAGGLAGAFVLGTYYFLMFQLFTRHCNHLFSAIRITGYKSFLRMKVDRNGDLTVYPIGVRRTEGRFDWLFRFGATSVEPDYALIENAVVIKRHTPLSGSKSP